MNGIYLNKKKDQSDGIEYTKETYGLKFFMEDKNVCVKIIATYLNDLIKRMNREFYSANAIVFFFSLILRILMLNYW